MGMLMRAWEVIDDRMGITKVVKPLMEHPVPKGSKWAYVFGSATLFSFILQIATGIALATSYVPSADGAYRSLKFISQDATFGHIVRGMHYFGASMMILFVGIHMFRVFLWGSYKYPREANWITGVILLMCTLVMGFTGQLLRWDQDAIWSVNIAARQAARVPFIGNWVQHFVYAGDRINANTLSRFFDLHVFIVPAVIIGIVGVHLYLVIYNGISEPPKAGNPVNPKTYKKEYEELLKKDGVPFWPDAAWRDAVFGSLVISVTVALAVIIGPPHLEKPPDPLLLHATPRPDWYLLWYFAILALSPHSIEDYLMIMVPAIIFIAMFLLPFKFNKGERAASRRPWAMAWFVIAVSGVLVLWRAGKVAAWAPRFEARGLNTASYDAANPQIHNGAVLFHDKGCEYCHMIHGQGGLRGPDLSDVADRLTPQMMTWRILDGGTNMPAYARVLHSDQVDELVAFLSTMKHEEHPILHTPTKGQANAEETQQ